MTLTHPSGACAELAYSTEDGWILELISVPVDLRHSKIGTTLVLDIIVWMKQTRIREVRFIPMNFEFWRAICARFPNKITLSTQGYGRIRS